MLCTVAHPLPPNVFLKDQGTAGLAIFMGSDGSSLLRASLRPRGLTADPECPAVRPRRRLRDDDGAPRWSGPPPGGSVAFALSIRNQFLYGASVWARRALGGLKRRFLARAVIEAAAAGCPTADPCASAPCLNGGACSGSAPAGFGTGHRLLQGEEGKVQSAGLTRGFGPALTRSNRDNLGQAAGSFYK